MGKNNPSGEDVCGGYARPLSARKLYIYSDFAMNSSVCKALLFVTDRKILRVVNFR